MTPLAQGTNEHMADGNHTDSRHLPTEGRRPDRPAEAAAQPPSEGKGGLMM